MSRGPVWTSWIFTSPAPGNRHPDFLQQIVSAERRLGVEIRWKLRSLLFVSL
jgi:hypothetical protein